MIIETIDDIVDRLRWARSRTKPTTWPHRAAFLTLDGELRELALFGAPVTLSVSIEGVAPKRTEIPEYRGDLGSFATLIAEISRLTPPGKYVIVGVDSEGSPDPARMSPRRRIGVDHLTIALARQGVLLFGIVVFGRTGRAGAYIDSVMREGPRQVVGHAGSRDFVDFDDVGFAEDLASRAAEAKARIPGG